MVLECKAERAGKLLTFLRRELQMSSTLVSRLKWENAFFINGQPAHTDHPVQPGERITVVMAERAEGYPAEDIPLDILYEDEYLIAVDKPMGMLIHPSPSRNTGTLANGLRYYYERTNQPCAVHPVSRLDRDTFGVVLLAKSAHVHAHFCRMQREGAIQKIYQAAVFGGPEANRGRIDLPIGRVGEGSLLRKIDQSGKPALTAYRVLERGQETSLLELCPLTGRTHQLRLHCLSMGFPILGDPQYQTAASAAFAEARGISPQQLCAKSLTFLHPLTGERICVVSKQTVWRP